MKEIIMATNNAGKVKEMQSLFAELNIKVLALKDVFSEPARIFITDKVFFIFPPLFTIYGTRRENMSIT